MSKKQKSSHFVRSGWIGVNTGRDPLIEAGIVGVTWSLRAYATTSYAYYIGFNASIVYSPGYDRWLGFPIRCLAR